ncbi:MAG: 16S rRNA (cytosine(967)-C(5))-methyltransferase RsmB, partial [Polaromonas sp.]|nr:16S rRNA (cytosine(967)-C(5))-methyltransferase RsmB [Polaromonas sp.]
MQDNPTQQIPLWRQLQGAAFLLMAVRAGRSMTAALEDVDAAIRPGVQALGFHALRQLGRAEALRQQLASRPPPPEADALLCVALALIWTDEGAPYTAHTLVDQAVEAAKRSEDARHQASFINGCLRRFLRERELLVAQTEKHPQAVWNHPQWWIDRLRKEHPAHWQAILRANNSRAPLTLRINQRKTTPVLYQQALIAINTGAILAGTHGLVLASAQPVPSLPGYIEGHFSVQDAAAQLAAPLLLDGLQASPGGRLRLLDACAAPGGKTAQLVSAGARVTAMDASKSRIKRLEGNLARLGLSAEIVNADILTYDPPRLFDAVLLDAPCSSTGTIRRHPDVLWTKTPDDIAKLAELQFRLLMRAVTMVRPGGTIVFSNCSLDPSEG